MTARDEAIWRLATYNHDDEDLANNPVTRALYGDMLDAIPNDVLVQLAIERGALELAGDSAWDADGQRVGLLLGVGLERLGIRRRSS